jgi:SAM-dependent methyltransferase
MAPLGLPAMERLDTLLTGLHVAGLGLEVAPYFNPALSKDRFNVRYVDYLDNVALKRKAAENPGAQHAPVPDIDWVWQPGQRLGKCLPPGTVFDYALASHVIEHVPNTLGWLNEILEVMKPGARLALAIPDRRYTMDFFRKETTLGDLVGNWITRPSTPTPAQVMDFLSQSFEDRRPPEELELPASFRDAPRHYDDQKALEFAIWSYNEGGYLDIHCTVWSPESFVAVMSRVCGLGILNVEISEPVIHPGRHEFIVQMVKRGEPAVTPPPARSGGL